MEVHLFEMKLLFLFETIIIYCFPWTFLPTVFNNLTISKIFVQIPWLQKHNFNLFTESNF